MYVRLHRNTDNYEGTDVGNADDEGDCFLERQPLFFVDAAPDHTDAETKDRSH